MKDINYEYEDIVSDDYRYMRGIMPAAALQVQRAVSDECDRMEYEGSIMYDAYPDKEQIAVMCNRVAHTCDIPANARPYIFPCMTYEMMLRRCRRHRRCGWKPGF